MNPILRMLLARLQAPADDDGSDTSGAGTGDDVSVAEDDEDAYLSLPPEERSRLRGDNTSTDPDIDTLAAVVASGAQGTQDEPGAGGEEEAEAAVASKGGGIPRARFNEINDRRKALEAENEALRAQLAGNAGSSGANGAQAAGQQRAFSIEAAEEEYAQLMLDGDAKAASALRVQINQALQDQAYARFAQENAAQQEQSKMAATVNRLLEQYPWLDTEDGQDALDAIEGAVMVRMQRGMSREQATVEAVTLIAPRFAPNGSPSKDGRAGGASVDIRVQRANERGAADSLLQPAALQAGMGNRASAPKIDSAKLTDDEYMALPEAERKKLRGDQM